MTPSSFSIVVFSVAMVAAEPARAEPPAPSKAPFVHPEYHLPPGAIAPPPVRKKPACNVSLYTYQDPKPDGRIRIVAAAINNTAAALTISAPDRCPAGPIAFTGLPAGYDYYQTCNVGKCPAKAPPRTWTLPPDREVILSEIVIDPTKSTCNRALPEHQFEVGFTLSLAVSTCGPVTTQIGHEPKKPPPPLKPRKPGVNCPRMPACAVVCNGPPLHDANGCPRCGCEDQTGVIR